MRAPSVGDGEAPRPRVHLREALLVVQHVRRCRDRGHAAAATSAAAGIVNPITGRRLVKSWRIDDLLPLARIFELRHMLPAILLAELVTLYFFGFYDLRDAASPVAVSLEAFSPFVPLNVDDSSLPATVMRFTVKNSGTQKVEATLAKLFPQVRVVRMDSDALKRKEDYRRILGDFRVGKIDILVGTQMIAKGLHFPNVTLVGIIFADLALNLPDFRAGERTFSLITQVAGRAGRGDVSGEVIVQTYTPFHPAVQAARQLRDRIVDIARPHAVPDRHHLRNIVLQRIAQAEVRQLRAAQHVLPRRDPLRVERHHGALQRRRTDRPRQRRRHRRQRGAARLGYDSAQGTGDVGAGAVAAGRD